MSEKLKKNFAKNLKSYMAMNNESQLDLANAVGVSQQSVSYWMQEKIFPRNDVLARIAYHYGITEMDLVEEKVDFFPIFEDKELVAWCQDAVTKENKAKYELLKVISSLPVDQYPSIRGLLIAFYGKAAAPQELQDKIKRADRLKNDRR